MDKRPTKLTIDPKHKIFADRYLLTGKVGQSAIDAGYLPNSAPVSGSRLLKRPEVQQYLASKAAKLNESTEDLQSQVLQELKTMAFSNIADFITIDAEGRPQVDFSGATDEQLRAIANVASKSRVTTDKDGRVTKEAESRFTMVDKYRGLELLGKHIGMFREPEQRVVIDVADRLLAARRRLRELGSDGSLVSD